MLAPRDHVVLPPKLGRQLMAYYRLYVRNGSADGRIIAFEEIDAADDHEAMRLATRHQGKFLELWQQARRVASFEPDRSQA